MMKNSALVKNIFTLIVLFPIIFIVNGQSKQNSSIIELLQEISSLQTTNSSQFPKGGFPSFRKYNYSRTYKADYNLFYTTILIYNLERYSPFLSKEEQSYVEKIKKNAIPYFELFKNKKHANSYNFWPKYPSVVFPNSGWLNWFNKKNALPDDVDDCAMAMLTIGPKDSSINELRTYFTKFSNGQSKKLKGFYKKYKNTPVYSTWLGKNYPIDVDVCVLTNVLLMNYSHKLNLTLNDTASLNLIVEIIKENKHISNPEYVSQHYENSSTILYHIARLMCFSDYKPLQELKPIIINNVKKRYLKAKYPLEQLLLQNTLLQLGEIDTTHAPINNNQLLKNNYPYFIANMTAILSNPLKKWIAATKIGRFSYYSYPFNLSLLFENLILTQRVKKDYFYGFK